MTDPDPKKFLAFFAWMLTIAITWLLFAGAFWLIVKAFS